MTPLVLSITLYIDAGEVVPEREVRRREESPNWVGDNGDLSCLLEVAIERFELGGAVRRGLAGPLPSESGGLERILLSLGADGGSCTLRHHGDRHPVVNEHVDEDGLLVVGVAQPDDAIAQGDEVRRLVWDAGVAASEARLSTALKASAVHAAPSSYGVYESPRMTAT